MYLVVGDAGSWMAAVGTDDQWSDATEFPLDDGRFRRLNDEPREEDQLTMVVTEPSCISPSTGNTLARWVYVKPARADWPLEPASTLKMLWTTPFSR
jgi:hypothetical protein